MLLYITRKTELKPSAKWETDEYFNTDISRIHFGNVFKNKKKTYKWRVWEEWDLMKKQTFVFMPTKQIHEEN